MKKKQPKLKETEKANAEIETPKNVDYIEISMTHEGLEKVAQDNAILLEQRNDPVLRRKFVRRQEKLLRKVFKAASQVLTTSTQAPVAYSLITLETSSICFTS